MARSLGRFTITHYTYALEYDPLYANEPKVTAPGLTGTYRRGFLYGLTSGPYKNSGVRMQGTGLTEDGRLIHYVSNGRFGPGPGGVHSTPVPWRTLAVDARVIPLGSKVELAVYREKGAFKATDKGEAIIGKKIDVFVGAVPLPIAFELGTKESEVFAVSDAEARPNPILLVYNRRPLACPVRSYDGKSYVPVTTLASELGMMDKVTWEFQSYQVYIRVSGTLLRDCRHESGTTWVWIRELMPLLGMDLTWDGTYNVIQLVNRRATVQAPAHV